MVFCSTFTFRGSSTLLVHHVTEFSEIQLVVSCAHGITQDVIYFLDSSQFYVLCTHFFVFLFLPVWSNRLKAASICSLLRFLQTSLNS